MSLDNAKNFAKVTVSTGYNAAATSIVLTTGHGAKLPTAPFNAVWYNSTDYSDPSDDPNVEIVRVTAISTDTLTVTRAQESTSASTKNTVGKTYKMIAGLTAKTINTDIPALVPSARIMVSTSFETAGRFSATATDSASVTFNTDGALIKSSADGSTGGSEQLLWRIGDIAAAASGLLFANSPVFTASLRIQNNGNANGTSFFVGIGEPTVATAGHTFTVAHIGFKMTHSGASTLDLRATQADGTETASSVLTTVTSGDKLELIAVVNGTSSVDYYWRKNGGALSSATNLSTHLPTSAASSIQFSASSDGFTNLGAFYMFAASYSR